MKSLISLAMLGLGYIGLILVSTPILWLFGERRVTGKEAAAMGLVGIPILAAAIITSRWYESRYPKEPRGFPLDPPANMPPDSKSRGRPKSAKGDRIMLWTFIAALGLLILVQIVRHGMPNQWRSGYSQPDAKNKQPGGKR